MVEIVRLETPENVTLVGGATQYWTDRPRPALGADWGELLAPQISGRTLVVGWTPTDTLRALHGSADELHVLVRGIVDASEIADALPDATIWCGDPRSLRNHAESFDTVICLADASRVLPLESEARTWREVVDDVLRLARPNGCVALWVENDLGVHRLTSPRNPRAERSDDTWNVMATFDPSRPLTLDRVRGEFPGAGIHVSWPSAQFSVLANPDTVDPATHAAFAQRACVAPLLGPDPAYMLAGAERAGRLPDFASGWFVTINPRRGLDAPLYLAEQGRVVALERTLPTHARSAFVVFAELAAAQDLPAVRRFVADWSAAHANPEAGAASFGLNVAEQDGDGRWGFTSLAEAPTTGEDRWEALGELVGMLRGRNWRHLWPANHTDARILNHLGIMAGLHTVSAAKAKQLIPPAPDQFGPFAGLDVQSLVAAIDRKNETIEALRSELELTERQLERSRTTTGLFRAPRKAYRLAKRVVKKALAG